MKCARCGAARPRANLTDVDGALVCPECLGKHAEHQISHQTPIRHERS